MIFWAFSPRQTFASTPLPLTPFPLTLSELRFEHNPQGVLVMQLAESSAQVSTDAMKSDVLGSPEARLLRFSPGAQHTCFTPASSGITSCSAHGAHAGLNTKHEHSNRGSLVFRQIEQRVSRRAYRATAPSHIPDRGPSNSPLEDQV